MPVAPTIFTDTEDLDIAGQRRVCDYLIDAGASGICILANFSEQFSITDAERSQLLDTVLDQVSGRVPVCVTASHFSARVAAERCRDAVRRGADMIMLMPPFFGKTLSVADTHVLEYFRRITESVGVPIMIQDAPISTTPMSVDLIGKIATENENIQYAKIEVPQAAAKIKSLQQFATVLPGIFDGEEAVTLIPDLSAGAIGTMSSALAAKELVDIMRQWQAGQRREAATAWEALLPLLHFENRQCGLAAAKVLLRAGGVIASDRTRMPVVPLSPDVRSMLISLAESRDAFALRWA